MSNNNMIISGFKSDHNAVMLPVKLESMNRGPGFWKLNCSLLEDQMYIDKINKCIDDCVIENPGTEDNEVSN